jgi:hypothetical protein
MKRKQQEGDYWVCVIFFKKLIPCTVHWYGSKGMWQGRENNIFVSIFGGFLAHGFCRWFSNSGEGIRVVD